MKRLRKVNVTAATTLLVNIDGGIGTDFTCGHIDILIRILIAKDDAAPQLCLAYQNISLRQSI